MRFDVEKARRALLEHRAAGVKKLADYVAEMARIFCPKDTLELHDSITVVPGRGNLEWFVVVTARHAEPVEFGHINVWSGKMVPANPFLRRALRLGALKFPEYVGGASGVNKGFDVGKAVSISFK
jgi:hypothetical protein